ncbi:MAG: hypothetical protein GX683_01185, partial [Ruminococcaceae bacterium]|nr:hypothetical protein [Oscillospiraceae bacterium]
PEEDATEQDEEKVKEKTAPRQNKKEAIKKDAKLKKEKKKPTAEKSGDKGEIGEKIAALFARVKGCFINPTEDETERETHADASELTGAPKKNTEPATPSGALDDANETTPAPEGGATLFDLEMPKGDLQLTAKKREHAKGALEFELEEDENELEEDKRYGRAVITVAAAVVALLVGLGIYAAATAATKEPVASDGVMLEYLEGEWLSEQYSYKDDEEVFYRELLSINEDETFSISYFIDDGANPEGYRDGTWTKTDSMQGIIAFNDADSSIFLRFEKLGENKEFVRYLLNTTDDTMTLREYYDKLKTDFYDVGFTRVG